LAPSEDLSGAFEAKHSNTIDAATARIQLQRAETLPANSPYWSNVATH
jgi:hypothetical protein